MAMPAQVVFSWILTLGATLNVYVDSSKVRGSQKGNVWYCGGEEEWVAIISKENLIDDHVSTGNQKGNAKSSEEPPFISLMARSVNPLEKADGKAEAGNHKDGNKVENCNIELTVHSVVQGRKGTPRNKDADSRIVETIGYQVYF